MTLSELLDFQSNRSRLEEIRRNRRNIVPFVGAGISKSCGLYTWKELLHALAVDYMSVDEMNSLESEGDCLKYADKIVAAVGNSDMIMKRIREIFYNAEISLTEMPYWLVSSFSPMVVTTNYDTLLEEASIHSSLGILKPILPCLVGQMNEAIQINDRCLLKVHGSVEEISSFIFTSEQYRRFYGEKGCRDGKVVPAYLMKIFSGKKVLFVGCSLESDNVLEILQECIENNSAVSHYAIVPYPSNADKQIRRKRELSRLGIEPIYYPEGDFQAVKQLLGYIAEENNFISSFKSILLNNFSDDEISGIQLQIIVSLLKESFYCTALKYPQLLDMDNMKNDFSKDILEFIGVSRRQSDTLLDICIDAFKAYVRSGYIRCENEVVTYFSEQFEDRVLKESEIEMLLLKKWAINNHLSSKEVNELAWITKLSDSEINKYANDLLQKLQYKNGMSFAELFPVYNLAKQFTSLVSERIDFDIRIRLLNSIGAFGTYFHDGEAAQRYLERSIHEIEKNGNTAKELMLFKAKCYANLAIARSLSNNDLVSVLEAAEKDIYLKQKYGENSQLYSRSLNFYATALKEIDPFKACSIYFEVADIKEKLAAGGQNKELLASWATTVFNIGLLAKDLEMYNLAYRIICYANRYRFETVDYCNRDYCSSVNVCAELEMFVHSKQNLEWLVRSVEARVDLPEGFSETHAHTWYICAYHYYLQGEYSTAIKYIHKSVRASKKPGALVDFRQDMRTQLLFGDIMAAQAKLEKASMDEAENIYKNIIVSLISMYGEDSYYLISPYRHLLQTTKREKQHVQYSCDYSRLIDKYAVRVKDLENQLEKYMSDRGDNLLRLTKGE